MTLNKHPELVAKVAKRLTGRPVEVRHRRPYVRQALGMAFNHHGRAIVDVSPDLTEREQLWVLCHELAHIKNDWDWLPDNNKAELPPASYDYTASGLKAATTNPIEDPADTAANEWVRYADAHTKTDDLPGRLRALSTWLPPELESLVNNAVEAALIRIRQEMGQK